MTVKNRVSNAQKIIWFVFLLSLLFITLWIGFYKVADINNRLWFWIEFLAYGSLSYAAANFLNVTFTEKKRHYRIAAGSTFIFGLILFLYSHLKISGGSLLTHISLLFMAAFVGSFIASNNRKGWWENNAPPTDAVEQEVIALHKAHMGKMVTRSRLKRLLDIIFSLVTMVISFPLWLIITAMIWFEDPGPVIFIKNAVGRGGSNFKQLKFRSMITHAEEETGPISGYENDERVLIIGKFLRKTALDELPQMINIILGNMSYVGPRPQRTVLVREYLQEFPQFTARHRVRPGLAGLAQVADSYHITPEEKLAWDLVYIQNANLWLDFKLALSAFLLVFGLRWRAKSQPEKIIRRLLKIEKPKI